MLSSLRQWLLAQGLGETAAAAVMLVADLAVVLLLAVIADRVVKRVIVNGVMRLTRRTASPWDDVIVRHHVLERLAHIAPALVIYHLVPSVLAEFPVVTAVVRQAALIYMIVVASVAASGALNAAVDIVRASDVPRVLPVKSVAQVIKLLVTLIAGVSILSLVLGRSPVLMLSGLGAMSAVLLLVFKDAILGFVAGIQLSANQMVSRGDWIEMPKYGADGDVLEVGLTSVKVQNWDKTVTTIPTYALISEAFKNWRGMSESGGRRIKRAITIDMNSIRFCDDAMLARFSEIQYITEYIARKRQEVATWNTEKGVEASNLPNRRRLTNIGTFRAYVEAYLWNHPMVHQQMTFLVRQLAPTGAGLPLEIYVFSRDQAWRNYEAIQADIFDHLFAILPEFDLRVFQTPSGSDIERALRPPPVPEPVE